MPTTQNGFARLLERILTYKNKNMNTNEKLSEETQEQSCKSGVISRFFLFTNIKLDLLKNMELLKGLITVFIIYVIYLICDYYDLKNEK